MDIKDLALIYAGIVSTISLVWNIINEFRKERRKLKINISLRNILVEELTLTGDIRDREYPPALSVEITNIGKVKLSFDRPTFQLKFAKLEGQNYFSVFSRDISDNIYKGHNINYPVQISPGDPPFKVDYNTGSLYEQVIQKIKNENKFYRFSKLRIIIYDEKGKKYKSKWVYLKEIEKVYEDFLIRNNYI